MGDSSGTIQPTCRGHPLNPPAEHFRAAPVEAPSPATRATLGRIRAWEAIRPRVISIGLKLVRLVARTRQ